MKALDKYCNKNHKTHLIFDFDSTIAQLVLPWAEWYIDVADKVAKRAPKLKDKSYVDIHNKYVLENGEDALIYIRSLNEEFEHKKLRGIKQNRRIISFIKNNPYYKFYIWSSNSRSTIDNALKKLGIKDLFLKTVTRSETRFIKPHPDGFVLLKDPGVKLDGYLLIGDSDYDKQAASVIGIDFFKVDYFHSDPD